jgi:hypothetical protein
MNNIVMQPSEMQYVTDAQGNRVGVVLGLEAYEQLIRPEPDKELLLNMSHAELEALAQSRLAISEQRRLDELLARNTAHSLSNSEQAELDHLLEQIDQLNILKTRARYTLHHDALLTTTG